MSSPKGQEEDERVHCIAVILKVPGIGVTLQTKGFSGKGLERWTGLRPCPVLPEELSRFSTLVSGGSPQPVLQLGGSDMSHASGTCTLPHTGTHILT